MYFLRCTEIIIEVNSMGSMITLGIGRMEIDWGKNNFYTNHSDLFQGGDLKDVPYYYVDKDGKEIVEMKRGFSKKIVSVKKRLDLLGYSLNKIENKFNANLDYINKLYDIYLPIEFKIYFNVVKKIDVESIDMTSEEYEYKYDLCEFARKCVLKEVNALVNDENVYAMSEFLENISPYITLRILAENNNNYDLDLIWTFADIVDNGWILEEEIKPFLSRDKKILIVTEGSSDTQIIKNSINLLHEDIADFFYFVDMEENYPFTGTGNLKNFIKGLSKIDIMNKILVILDNDTAGVSTYNELKNITLPDNLRILTLPNHKSFENIKCYGPQGISFENVNGKAVAIEAFLDFNSVKEDVYVRWTSYNERLDQYQGVFEPKNDLTRAFHVFYKKNYNFTKIDYLIDHILKILTG